ncbi:MAG: ATP-dependent helicase [Cyanobacteria bacterium P01_H01_bin.15]
MGRPAILATEFENLRDSLRSGQKALADWHGGPLAVSAVPGAGKSHSLAIAAALAIARFQLHARKQLVIVTYTRSAAAAIKNKVRAQLRSLQLPSGGFTVQTLHGLALNIASRYPALSGLDLQASKLITPNQSHRLLKVAVEEWISDERQSFFRLVEGTNFDGEEAGRLGRQTVLRSEILPSLAHTVIREAKSSGLTPADLWEMSRQTHDHYGILRIAAGLYERYAMQLRSQELIDYDDMILAALRVLDESSIRQQWQSQVFAVFEDEAQDSSPLQERLITTLAGDPADPECPPNLVRVGDPNQAINSTFTPADPLYFNWFCQTCQAQNRLTTMNQAGRSTQRILAASNFILQWVAQQWERKTKRPAVDSFRVQAIVAVPPDDPQPDANPTPTGQGVEVVYPPTVFDTVKLICDRIGILLTETPEHSAVVLVRTNNQGRFVAKHLEKLCDRGIEVYEVGEAERHSRVPQEMLALLQFVERPHSPDYLKNALNVLIERQLIPAQNLTTVAAFPEQFLYPSPLAAPLSPNAEKARHFCNSLLQAKIALPYYQLLSFLGMALQYDGSELATAQKLADRLILEVGRGGELGFAIASLQDLINSEQFKAVEEDSDDKYSRPGQVTIITMHKAKGLDWDYGFIPFLQEDTIPGSARVPTAAQFLGDYTLGEVARAQIRSALHQQYQGQTPPHIPEPLQAWRSAELLKKAEEYRLLYVAMTRPKRLLWLAAAQEAPFSWGGFSGDRESNLQSKKPCPVLPELGRFLARSGPVDDLDF